jgi:hypothetical protein
MRALNREVISQRIKFLDWNELRAFCARNNATLISVSFQPLNWKR